MHQRWSIHIMYMSNFPDGDELNLKYIKHGMMWYHIIAMASFYTYTTILYFKLKSKNPMHTILSTCGLQLVDRFLAVLCSFFVRIFLSSWFCYIAICIFLLSLVVAARLLPDLREPTGRTRWWSGRTFESMAKSCPLGRSFQWSWHISQSVQCHFQISTQEVPAGHERRQGLVWNRRI